MEIKTCEQYVLAELAEWKARAEKAESDTAILRELQKIFNVTDNKETGVLNIGINEEVLDAQKDSMAVGRISLLRALFCHDQPAEDMQQPQVPQDGEYNVDDESLFVEDLESAGSPEAVGGSAE